MNTPRVLAKASATALALAALFGAAPAFATEESPRASVEAAALASGSGAGRGLGVLLGARLHSRAGAQLGFAVAGQALELAYLGGQTATGLMAGEATLLGLLPLLRASSLELDFRLATGVRYLRDLGVHDTPHTSSLRSVTELAWLAHVRLDRRHLLRAGVLIALELETTPTMALADQMQLLSVGLGRAIAPNVALMAAVEAGGSYGFDGDNGKAVLRGSLALRVAFDGDALVAF